MIVVNNSDSFWSLINIIDEENCFWLRRVKPFFCFLLLATGIVFGYL